MSGPVSMADDPSTLLIVNSWSEDALFVDLESFTVTGRMEMPPQPHETRFDPERGVVYISFPYEDGYYDDHEVKAHHLAILDPEAREIVEMIDLAPELGPHAICLDSAADVLWMSVETDGGAVVGLDLGSREIVGRIPTGGGGGKPHWMTMTADGSKIYTANKESRFASVIDLRMGEMVDQISTPGGCEDVELSVDGSRLFLTSREDPILHVVDTATDQPRTDVELDDVPGRLAMTSRGELLITHYHFPYQTEGRIEQGRLSMVDPKTLVQGRSLTIGRGPVDLTTSADGRLAYVSHGQSSTVYEIDLDEMDTRRVLRAGTAPHGLLVL